jgi:hypothetical protein
MGFKVYDFDCTCGHLLRDALVKEEQGNIPAEEIPTCEHCGAVMRRMFPAPAGYVYDTGQIASKRAMLKAFKAKSKALCYPPGSKERKEAQTEEKVLLTPGVT